MPSFLLAVLVLFSCSKNILAAGKGRPLPEQVVFNNLQRAFDETEPLPELNLIEFSTAFYVELFLSHSTTRAEFEEQLPHLDSHEISLLPDFAAKERAGSLTSDEKAHLEALGSHVAYLAGTKRRGRTPAEFDPFAELDRVGKVRQFRKVYESHQVALADLNNLLKDKKEFTNVLDEINDLEHVAPIASARGEEFAARVNQLVSQKTDVFTGLALIQELEQHQRKEIEDLEKELHKTEAWIVTPLISTSAPAEST